MALTHNLDQLVKWYCDKNVKCVFKCQNALNPRLLICSNLICSLCTAGVNILFAISICVRRKKKKLQSYAINTEQHAS